MWENDSVVLTVNDYIVSRRIGITEFHMVGDKLLALSNRRIGVLDLRFPKWVNLELIRGWRHADARPSIYNSRIVFPMYSQITLWDIGTMKMDCSFFLEERAKQVFMSHGKFVVRGTKSCKVYDFLGK